MRLFDKGQPYESKLTFQGCARALSLDTGGSPEHGKDFLPVTRGRFPKKLAIHTSTLIKHISGERHLNNDINGLRPYYFSRGAYRGGKQ